MADYSDDIAGALEDIAEAGEACTWFKPASQAGTPSRPEAGASPTQTPVFILFLPNKQASMLTILSALADSNVPGGSEKGLMGNHGFTPELGDWIIRANSERMTIVPENGIDTLAPSGVAILHTIRFVR